MTIPKLHYISQGSSPKEHLKNIQKACASGIELVQLGLENVSEKRILKIAQEAREITAHYQTRLIIQKEYNIAKEVKADGVYLGITDTCPTLVRKQLYTWQMVGAAATSLQECETALLKKVDYIGLGPFRTPKLQKDVPFLGLNGYILVIEALKTHIRYMIKGLLILAKSFFLRFL